MNGRGDLVFIGDVHLDQNDPDLPAFLRFLRSLVPRAGRIVLLGDLFNLWIGRRDMEMPHHRAVVDVLSGLRREGVSVRYVEGNRDYRIAGPYAGTAVDDATDRGVVEEQGGRRYVAIHGDLANPADRQYRAWRRVSRSGAVWKAFSLLPAQRRLALAEGLEARMRRSNSGYKGVFPEEAVRAYAAGLLARNADVVVMGHFHVERDFEARPPSPPGRVLVLPEWKGSRRYLRVPEGGSARFESTGSER